MEFAQRDPRKTVSMPVFAAAVHTGVRNTHKNRDAQVANTCESFKGKWAAKSPTALSPFWSNFVCEFKGSSRVPGGWNNGVRHSNDVLLKNNKYKDVYGIVHKAFAPAIVRNWGFSMGEGQGIQLQQDFSW